MKRARQMRMVLVAALVMLLWLAACGGGGNAGDSNADNGTVQPAFVLTENSVDKVMQLLSDASFCMPMGENPAATGSAVLHIICEMFTNGGTAVVGNRAITYTFTGSSEDEKGDLLVSVDGLTLSYRLPLPYNRLDCIPAVVFSGLHSGAVIDITVDRLTITMPYGETAQTVTLSDLTLTITEGAGDHTMKMDFTAAMAIDDSASLMISTPTPLVFTAPPLSDLVAGQLQFKGVDDTTLFITKNEDNQTPNQFIVETDLSGNGQYEEMAQLDCGGMADLFKPWNCLTGRWLDSDMVCSDQK
jgi:hypothetical protein